MVVTPNYGAGALEMRDGEPHKKLATVEALAEKLVRLGERDDHGVGIISGLDAGAQVATSNLSQLFDGAPVSIKNRN